MCIHSEPDNLLIVALGERKTINPQKNGPITGRLRGGRGYVFATNIEVLSEYSLNSSSIETNWNETYRVFQELVSE
jgi:hypothetical protein